MDTNTTGIATWQWVVSVIVLIALIVLGVYLFTGTGPAREIETDQTPTTGINEVNRLVVTDQYPGNIVFITTVQLAKPGFITITTDTGKVIGKQDFASGINTGKVTLTESTLANGTYHALLYYTDAPMTVLLDKVFKARTDLPEPKG